jgi:peptidoglycan hydrolase CwlO-like protein
MPFDWQTIVAIISVIVAFASWATSARKSRVDNLCQIIDSQAEHIVAQAQEIAELRTELTQAQATIKSLQAELTQAKGRITELELLNKHYRTLLHMNHIDPGEPHG